MAGLVRREYPEAQLIAGVATGAIALGVLVADVLDLPFVYVRSASKGHGLGNQIEGAYEPGQKTVVIEDLVSTGKSSLKAVECLREAGCDVLGMTSIFTYGFDLATSAFDQMDCKLFSLSDYHHLLQSAVESGAISEDEVALLSAWREEPSTWGT